MQGCLFLSQAGGVFFRRHGALLLSHDEGRYILQKVYKLGSLSLYPLTRARTCHVYNILQYIAYIQRTCAAFALKILETSSPADTKQLKLAVLFALDPISYSLQSSFQAWVRKKHISYELDMFFRVNKSRIRDEELPMPLPSPAQL